MALPDVIIVGASARAAAASALRAGLSPWCADLFADRDLQAIAPAYACAHGSYPMGLVALVKAAKLPASTPVLLTGAMENHLPAVSALQAMHPIFGPDVAQIKQLRVISRQCHDMTLPAIAGLRWPVTRSAAGSSLINTVGRGWMLKPQDSAGGVAVRKRRLWSRTRPNELRQQFIQGRSIGAVFRSTNNQAPGSSTCQLLGVSTQIIGDKHFASKGYRYVGSIGPLPMTPRQNHALQSLGNWLVAMSPFTGIFGVDLILDAQGDLWPIEINPRYTASVEVLEKACHFAALNPHSNPMTPQLSATCIVGKAYVFAKRSTLAPDLYDGFDPSVIADVPEIDSPLSKGHPICTLYATAVSHEACLEKLREQAGTLYTRLQ